MQFGLLENGIDSIKVTGDILLEYYQDDEFQDYQIKDAVLSFVHGVEVLSKYIIKAENEEMIFRDKNEYRLAKEKIDGINKINVFDVTPDLNTITVTKSLNILNSGDWKLRGDLHKKLLQIVLLRNQLMHYTVDLKEEEFIYFINRLRESFHEMVEFFDANIPRFKEVFDKSVREIGLTNYEMYLDELQIRAEMANEDARLEAQADYYDTLEDYHKH